jgi:hypothetical protein
MRSIGNAAVKQYIKEQAEGVGEQDIREMFKRKSKTGRDRAEIVAAGKKVRVIYTMIIHHIPLCDELWLTRLINSFKNDPDFFQLGHCNREAVLEIIRLIANDLRGFVDFQTNVVRFIASSMDGSNSVRRFAFTCEWIKFVYPPANVALLCTIPPTPSTYQPSAAAAAAYEAAQAQYSGLSSVC